MEQLCAAISRVHQTTAGSPMRQQYYQYDRLHAAKRALHQQLVDLRVMEAAERERLRQQNTRTDAILNCARAHREARAQASARSAAELKAAVESTERYKAELAKAVAQAKAAASAASELKAAFEGAERHTTDLAKAVVEAQAVAFAALEESKRVNTEFATASAEWKAAADAATERHRQEITDERKAHEASMTAALKDMQMMMKQPNKAPHTDDSVHGGDSKSVVVDLGSSAVVRTVDNSGHFAQPNPSHEHGLPHPSSPGTVVN